MNEDFFIYLWLAFISLIGAVTGFFSKVGDKLQNKTQNERLKVLFLGIITSMFIAYITYEFAFYLINKSGLSVAVAGLAAFLGTDFVIVLEKKIIDLIDKKLRL